MEDLTMEQIIQMGQQYFPQIDPNVIAQKFEQLKELFPDMSNLEVAQVAFQSYNDKGGSNFSELREKMGR